MVEMAAMKGLIAEAYAMRVTGQYVNEAGICARKKIWNDNAWLGGDAS